MASLTSHPAQHAARLPALAFLLVALTRIAAGAEPPNKPAAPHEKPGHPTENRLANETSPYLLMHATNPVDWYPWGEEALERAQREKKLIFLSIGYSSCYWCHVMERESFMDEEIAKMLNENFVCIKVDREERPDVDEIYMTSLQIYFRLVGSPRGGGWPLSMFLTPDAEPVLGGTYFPPREKPGRPGFLQVLNQIHDAWEKEPQKFLTQGLAVARLVRENLQTQDAEPARPLDSKPVEATLAQLSEQYDAQFGGFGYSEANPQSPKFPEPSNLVYLLDRADAGHEAAGKMLIGTLESMARGGIRDHLGGGFHRYSTDRYWRVPHFEKMLYDNGQLASVYARAYAMTGQQEFRRVVEQLVEFVLREMTDPAGGFYSALDAETDAVEGKYYVWTRDELGESLPADDLALLAELYGTGGEANFEEHYVLLLDRPLAARAEARGMSEAELVDRWEPLRQTLLKLRDERKRPLTDTKILTAWNGLMIRGLADAGRLLERPAYVEAATRSARFVLNKLKTPDGRLLRSFAGGNAKLNGYLDDYAFLVDGLIALHEATGDDAWLEAADRLTAKQIELFWDDKAGGFYFTSHDHEKLFARGKKPTDGALPSGNSVAAANLIYLAAALERPDYRERAEETIQSALPLLTRAPTAAPRMAAALAAFLESKPAP